MRFAPSFLIGLLLVPASAIAANSLVSSTPVEPELEVQVYHESMVDYYRNSQSTAAASVDRTAPTTATNEDMALACGIEGLALVEKETAETITAVEMAALAALRPICEEAGMPLPGAPEPPPIIETVTVIQGGGGGGTAAAAVDAQYEAFLAAYASAEAAVQRAIAANGSPGIINDAIDKLNEAQVKAAKGDYGKAIEKAVQAEQKAIKALEADDDSHEEDDDEREGGDD